MTIKTKKAAVEPLKSVIAITIEQIPTAYHSDKRPQGDNAPYDNCQPLSNTHRVEDLFGYKDTNNSINNLKKLINNWNISDEKSFVYIVANCIGAEPSIERQKRANKAEEISYYLNLPQYSLRIGLHNLNAENYTGVRNRPMNHGVTLKDLRKKDTFKARKGVKVNEYVYIYWTEQRLKNIAKAILHLLETGVWDKTIAEPDYTNPKPDINKPISGIPLTNLSGLYTNEIVDSIDKKIKGGVGEDMSISEIIAKYNCYITKFPTKKGIGYALVFLYYREHQGEKINVIPLNFEITQNIYRTLKNKYNIQTNPAADVLWTYWTKEFIRYNNTKRSALDDDTKYNYLVHNIMGYWQDKLLNDDENHPHVLHQYTKNTTEKEYINDINAYDVLINTSNTDKADKNAIELPLAIPSTTNFKTLLVNILSQNGYTNGKDYKIRYFKSSPYRANRGEKNVQECWLTVRNAPTTVPIAEDDFDDIESLTNYVCGLVDSKWSSKKKAKQTTTFNVGDLICYKGVEESVFKIVGTKGNNYIVIELGDRTRTKNTIPFADNDKLQKAVSPLLISEAKLVKNNKEVKVGDEFIKPKEWELPNAWLSDNIKDKYDLFYVSYVHPDGTILLYDEQSGKTERYTQSEFYQLGLQFYKHYSKDNGISGTSENLIQDFQENIWKNGFNSVTLRQLDNLIKGRFY